MSLNQILNPVKRLDIKCGELDFQNLVTENPVILDDLTIKTQNGDELNLSSLPDKGTGGYLLASNGNGNVSWVAGGGGGGVNYDGVVPVSVGKLALYNAPNGLLIKDSSLSETDLLNTQSKTQNIISASPTETKFNNIIQCKTFQDIDRTAIFFDDEINMSGYNINNVSGIFSVGINLNNITSKINQNINIQCLGPSQGKVIFNCDLSTPSIASLNALNSTVSTLTNKTQNITTVIPNNTTFTGTIECNVLKSNSIINNGTIGTNNLLTTSISAPTLSYVVVSSDLNFSNLYNIIGLNTINGIKATGGVFSSAPNASLIGAQLTPVNLFTLGVGYGSLTVPNGGFQEGDSFSLKMGGNITCALNDDFILSLETTGTAPAVFGTFNVEFDTPQSAGFFEFEIEFIVRTVGTTGTASISTNGNFQYINNNGFVKGVGIDTFNNTSFSTITSNTLALFYTTTQASINPIIISQISLTKTF